jgi:hypothetical protein
MQTLGPAHGDDRPSHRRVPAVWRGGSVCGQRSAGGKILDREVRLPLEPIRRDHDRA